MGWRKVRKANIDQSERDTFERYGETVIAITLVSGQTGAEILKVQTDEDAFKHAAEWLSERADKHFRRERRLEWLEWAIVILIGFEILLSLFGKK